MSFGKILPVALATLALSTAGFAWANSPEAPASLTQQTTIETTEKVPVAEQTLKVESMTDSTSSSSEQEKADKSDKKTDKLDKKHLANNKDTETVKEKKSEKCKIDKNGVEKCEGKQKVWSTDKNPNTDTSLNNPGLNNSTNSSTTVESTTTTR